MLSLTCDYPVTLYGQLEYTYEVGDSGGHEAYGLTAEMVLELEKMLSTLKQLEAQVNYPITYYGCISFTYKKGTSTHSGGCDLTAEMVLELEKLILSLSALS